MSRLDHLSCRLSSAFLAGISWPRSFPPHPAQPWLSWFFPILALPFLARGHPDSQPPETKTRISSNMKDWPTFHQCLPPPPPASLPPPCKKILGVRDRMLPTTYTKKLGNGQKSGFHGGNGIREPVGTAGREGGNHQGKGGWKRGGHARTLVSIGNRIYGMFGRWPPLFFFLSWLFYLFSLVVGEVNLHSAWDIVWRCVWVRGAVAPVSIYRLSVCVFCLSRQYTNLFVCFQMWCFPLLTTAYNILWRLYSGLCKVFRQRAHLLLWPSVCCI